MGKDRFGDAVLLAFGLLIVFSFLQSITGLKLFGYLAVAPCLLVIAFGALCLISLLFNFLVDLFSVFYR